jgi:hypothetical protein
MDTPEEFRYAEGTQSIIITPSQSPQLWYGDGVMVLRLDVDLEDRASTLARKDLRVIRALLDEAIDNITEAKTQLDVAKMERNKRNA